MNKNLKNPLLIPAAEHACCLSGGVPDPNEAFADDLEYWAQFPKELIDLASGWVPLIVNGPCSINTSITMGLKYASDKFHEYMNPIPGEEVIDTDILEIKRIHGSDDYYLLWRDVCVTWYQYTGRCMYISRLLDKDEVTQFGKELFKALEDYECLSRK